ncbi:MAG: N-acetylglucosaminyldiphosphoundecaprenol N-acetyl-beta-D-mannosaminyltransferase [Planctomycetota bacterium]|jgi:N-acetylglucosaminyldiphosphoundecaprenol N-acetyl-beta-D-mannosaminyltransferase
MNTQTEEPKLAETKSLLGVPFWTKGRTELRDLMRTSTTLIELNGINAEVSIQAQDDAEHFGLLANNPTNLIDGEGVRKLLRFKYGESYERISGSDYAADLCSLAHEEGWGVFLLGGSEESSAGAAKAMAKRFPGLRLEFYSPPFESNLDGTPLRGLGAACDEVVLQRLDAFRPELLIGCFGAPKQEIWFRLHRDWLAERGCRVWMGAGGTFDFLSGRVTRAPKLISRLGFEWLWRLAKNPVQRIGRMARRLPRFAVLGLTEALSYRIGRRPR